MWLIQVDRYSSIGWFNWLDQLANSVVGPYDWFMWSVRAVDPNAGICDDIWLVRLVGSVGRFNWLVHVDDSIGWFMWYANMGESNGLTGWFQSLLQMVGVCGRFRGWSEVGSVVGPFGWFNWLVGSLGWFKWLHQSLLRLVA